MSLRVYQVVKRDGKVTEFEISEISKTISKAFIDVMAREIYPDVLDLLNLSVEDWDDLTHEEEIAIKKILRKKVEYIRLMWKAKAAEISQQLRQLWMNRNKGANRSNTAAVTDMMLMTMPVPPTAATANCSLWQRGILSGATA